MLQNHSKNIGLYIHVPFCVRKCLFCSFVVAIGQEHRMKDYVDALIVQAEAYEGASIGTVYLGGGTPSYLPDEELARLMASVRVNFNIAPDAEITIETNPEHITAHKAATLKQLGFTRVSLGIQTMDERYLKFLGRNHDGRRACEAYAALNTAGLDNINVDLMYGFPKQKLEEVEADMAVLAALGSQHMSVYTLTVEPNSRFFARQVKLDDDDRLAEHYKAVCHVLPFYDFNQYEISNFAKKGFESRHNQHYWEGGEYIGLGVGAHGFLNHRRYWNPDKLSDYLSNPTAVGGFEDLDARTRLMERICFGLRTSKGIGEDVIPDDKRGLIDEWIKDGFLVRANNRIAATLAGQLVLDVLSAGLI